MTFLTDCGNKILDSVRLFNIVEAKIGGIDCHPAMWEVRGYVRGIIAAALVGVTLPHSRI